MLKASELHWGGFVDIWSSHILKLIVLIIFYSSTVCTLNQQLLDNQESQGAKVICHASKSEVWSLIGVAIRDVSVIQLATPISNKTTTYVVTSMRDVCFLHLSFLELSSRCSLNWLLSLSTLRRPLCHAIRAHVHWDFWWRFTVYASGSRVRTFM